VIEIKDFTKLVSSESLSQDEVRAVIVRLLGQPISEAEAQPLFNQLRTHITNGLQRFNALLYPGFSPFSPSDIFDFLLNDAQFSLSINKVKGQGVLYGLEQAKARAFFVNGLPEKIKKAVLKRKVSATGVFTKELAASLDMRVSWGKNLLDSIQSIEDIGVGSSLYLIEFPEKKWVLKKGGQSFQTFFSELLDCLKWPSFTSIPVLNEAGRWDLMSYVGAKTLGCVVLESSCDDVLLTQAAQHAALGDVLGRGDRHFQNYMVESGALYPIDLHYLFWEENEKWVTRYLSAGMSEYALLILWQGEAFQKKSDLFFKTYADTIHFLQDESSTITTFIKSFFEPSPETERRCKYVLSRVLNPTYIAEQKARYIEAFSVYVKRVKYKTVLEQIGERYPALLNDYPQLKMYYYADKDKLSAFFLAEESGYSGVYETIEQVGKRVLSLPEGFWRREA
jgi:hypothetical protein